MPDAGPVRPWRPEAEAAPGAGAEGCDVCNSRWPLTNPTSCGACFQMSCWALGGTQVQAERRTLSTTH